MQGLSNLISASLSSLCARVTSQLAVNSVHEFIGTIEKEVIDTRSYSEKSDYYNIISPKGSSSKKRDSNSNKLFDIVGSE